MDVCKKLDLSWKSLGSYKSIPLEKGFCEFVFSSLENMRRVLVVGSWDNLSILRVLPWIKDFVSSSIKLTKAQC